MTAVSDELVASLTEPVVSALADQGAGGTYDPTQRTDESLMQDVAANDDSELEQLRLSWVHLDDRAKKDAHERRMAQVAKRVSAKAGSGPSVSRLVVRLHKNVTITMTIGAIVVDLLTTFLRKCNWDACLDGFNVRNGYRVARNEVARGVVAASERDAHTETMGGDAGASRSRTPVRNEPPVAGSKAIARVDEAVEQSEGVCVCVVLLCESLQLTNMFRSGDGRRRGGARATRVALGQLDRECEAGGTRQAYERGCAAHLVRVGEHPQSAGASAAVCDCHRRAPDWYRKAVDSPEAAVEPPPKIMAAARQEAAAAHDTKRVRFSAPDTEPVLARSSVASAK